MTGPVFIGVWQWERAASAIDPEDLAGLHP